MPRSAGSIDGERSGNACNGCMGSVRTSPPFSDTWQLFINAGTTVLTFLMVFVIQDSLNRDSAAAHVKLDGLICVTSEVRDPFVGAEHMIEEEPDRIREEIENRASSNEHDSPDRPS